MVKEVEIKKLNGKTQYVDWETGEELFKKSDCIPIKDIEDKIKEIEKELRQEYGAMPSAEFDYKIMALDVYKRMLKEWI